MNRQPLELRKISTRGLKITWSDNSSIELASEILRRNCPCAGCREQRGEINHSAPLPTSAKSSSLLKVIEHSVSEETQLEEIWAIGNYAIGVKWGDGHSHGIYTYELLDSLCRNNSGDDQTKN